MVTSYDRSHISVPDIHMATARGGFTLSGRADIHMETYRPAMTTKKTALQLWERELLDAPEVRRKATVAQLCVSFVLLAVLTRTDVRARSQISWITTSRLWDTSRLGRKEELDLMLIREEGASCHHRRNMRKSSNRTVGGNAWCYEGGGQS